MRSLWIGLSLLGVMLLGGCEAAKNTPATKATNSKATNTSVNLTIGSVDEYNQLLAANQGKVILVDFWATWCIPCVENFPHTVELAHCYEDQGLATIAVSLDDPENEGNVRAFLAAQDNVTFANLLSEDGGGQKSAEAFELSGAVPHYRLYDRSGKLVLAEDGLPEDLEGRIKELLAQDAN